MAPRPPVAGSSKRAATNGQAGPSRLAAPTPKITKKRPVQVESEEEDEDDFAMNGDGIDMDEDEGDVEEDADSDEDDDEAFPELDSGSEGDAEEDEEGEEDEAADTEDEELDDEETGSESGYNSSDIDAMDSASTSVTSAEDEDGNEISVDEKLSRLVAKNTVKPNEAIGGDEKISTAKEGFGKLKPSKLVPGGYLREYDEIEAGYGSESSTEDVSLIRTAPKTTD